MVAVLTVYVRHESSVNDLIDRYPAFSFLPRLVNRTLFSSDFNRDGRTTHDFQVLFLGKTGYGKSSTINAIAGSSFMETDAVEICTKSLQSIEYTLNAQRNYYFSLCDFPGIGESEKADAAYYTWYTEMLQRCCCVVYILRADQRDYSLDLKAFQELMRDHYQHTILALNFADKIEPIDRYSELPVSNLQLSHLRQKVSTVSRLFSIPQERIVYYSASEQYNISSLAQTIAYVIQQTIL